MLLNNGRRELPSPDSPSEEGDKVQSPPATCTSTKSPSPWEAESSKNSPSPGGAESSKKSPSPGEAEPVKQKPSGIGRMMEGERGDIIHFYNKVSHRWGIDVWCGGVEGMVSWKLTSCPGLHWLHQGVCAAVPESSG